MIFENKIKEIYKNKVFRRCDDLGTAYYFSAKDFKGLQCREYRFKASAGHMLSGFFYYYNSPIKGRIVIFDHGFGGGHLSYMKEIELLARHGYLVFAYDHTGCMRSEGNGCNGFSQSICDLNDCLNTLKSEEALKEMKFSVIGHSWGGLAVQNIAMFHPDVCHIIAISGPLSVERMLRQSFSGILSPYYNSILQLEKETNPKFAECDAVKALKKTSAKVLIIFSDDDKTVNVRKHFKYLMEQLGDKENIEFLAEHGKKHNPNYTRDAVIYLNEYLSELTKKYKKGQLSSEAQKAEFVKKFDWNRMTAQDPKVWEKIFGTLDS